MDFLLQNLKPILNNDDYVFYTINTKIENILNLNPWSIIQEEEGLTLIIKKKIAYRNNIKYSDIYKRITLNVYSSLNSVGLTAKISTELCIYGISANIIAGFYHDHIFVKKEKAKKALKILLKLQTKSG